MPGASEIKAGEAFVEIGAKIGPQFARTFGRIRKRFAAFGRRIATSMARIGKVAALAFGVAFTLGMRKAIREFVNLETKVTEVGTLLDQFGKTAFQGIKREAQELAMVFGQTTDAMLGAKYDVVSAGFSSVADSATIMRVAVKAATAGMVNAKDAAGLIISGLRGYALEASEAGRVSDILFSIVKFGRTTMTELGASMGMLMPTAKAAGVSLEDLGAMMATVTMTMDTPKAVTALNGLFIAMVSPTKEAAKAMKKLGIVTSDSFGKMLAPAKVLAQFKGKSLADIMKIVPERESARGLLAMASDFKLLGDNLKNFQNTAGATETAFKRMTKRLGFIMKRLSATWDVLFQDMGEAIAPSLSRAVTRIQAFFQTNRDTIKAFVRDTWDKMVEAIDKFVAQDSLEGWADRVKNAFTGIFETIKTVIAGMVAFAQGLRIIHKIAANISTETEAQQAAVDASDDLKSMLVVMRRRAAGKADVETGLERAMLAVRHQVSPGGIAKAQEQLKARESLRSRREGGLTQDTRQGLWDSMIADLTQTWKDSEEKLIQTKLGMVGSLADPVQSLLDNLETIHASGKKATKAFGAVTKPFEPGVSKPAPKMDPLSKRFGELAQSFVGKIDTGVSKLRDFLGFNFKAPQGPGAAPMPGAAMPDVTGFGTVGASALSGATTAQLNRMGTIAVDEKTTLLREIRDSLVGRATVSVAG